MCAHPTNFPDPFTTAGPGHTGVSRGVCMLCSAGRLFWGWGWGEHYYHLIQLLLGLQSLSWVDGGTKQLAYLDGIHVVRGGYYTGGMQQHG